MVNPIRCKANRKRTARPMLPGALHRRIGGEVAKAARGMEGDRRIRKDPAEQNPAYGTLEPTF